MAKNTACENMELGGCGLKWRGSSVKGIVFCPLHRAAPEMLEALNVVRDELRQIIAYVKFENPENKHEAEKSLALVERVIAKAEG